jgi:hypothetical protein
MIQINMLKPSMAALKVLAAALVERRIGNDIVEAGRIMQDVEETEAILAEYWEGVLGETR